MSFADQVIIVTGAAGNVGSALLRLLHARGALTAGVDREAAPLDPARIGIADPSRYLALPVADLAEEAEAAAMVARTLERFGRIDGLAHTVGGFDMAPLAQQDGAMWERMLRLNLLTTVSVLRAVLPVMRGAGRGSIVAVGAGAAALRAPAGMAAYAGAKSAVHRLVESAAEELKPERIRVNAVLPSIIDTPENRAAMPDADVTRWATTAEVAAAMAFLLSEEASGITGALLPVTGRV